MSRFSEVLEAGLRRVELSFVLLVSLPVDAGFLALRTRWPTADLGIQLIVWFALCVAAAILLALVAARARKAGAPPEVASEWGELLACEAFLWASAFWVLLPFEGGKVVSAFDRWDVGFLGVGAAIAFFSVYRLYRYIRAEEVL